MDESTEKVLSTVASVRHISRERVSLESSLEELEFDSLDRVTLLFELEKAFQISISDDEARSIRNVRDVVEGVAKVVAGAALDSAAPEAIK